jgi:hypothetical protein
MISTGDTAVALQFVAFGAFLATAAMTNRSRSEVA